MPDIEKPRNFYWLWLSTAFPAAWTLGETAAGLVGLVALYLAKRHPDWQGSLTDLGWQIPLAVFAMIFVIRLVLAPLEIYLAQREVIASREGTVTGRDQEIKALKADLDGRKRDRQFAELLAKKDEWAVHNLWAKRPQNENEFFPWLRSVQQWEKEIEQMLEEQGCPYLELKDFRVLGELEYPAEPFSSWSMLNHQLVMLSMKRRRLRVIIDSYAAGRVWPPSSSSE